ncbi:LTA synthase family protein [Bacteroidota bacterium]
MRKRITLYVYYAIYWLFFFIIIKIVFLCFHFSQSSEIGLIDCFRVLWHGLKLDISTTAYLLVIPTVFIIIFSYSGKKLYDLFFRIYTLFFLTVICFLCIVDLELYKHWGFRLDTTPLMYINTPVEMLASTEWFVILRQVFIGVIIFLVAWLLYRKLFHNKWKKLVNSDWKSSVAFLLILSFLIIPIRGGLGIAPINTGSVYFHNNMYANHAANNLIWNLGYSISKLDKVGKEWNFMEDSIAESRFRKLMKQSGSREEVISGKPNIIFIILESFTSKIIEPLGGKKGITPNFNKLADEGILFNNFFASSNRSDKGIVSMLSGQPALSESSIIKYPQKTQSLPGINKDLKTIGYNSAFYYGGEIDFANFRSYFINMGYDKIVSMDDFDESQYNSKWGVHDHILFDRFFNDLKEVKNPFFRVLFTLSSHEPFDVPMETVIKGNDDDSKFFNSAFYTDKCLGEFINKAKTQEWWDNSLIVIMADHGSRLPGNSRNHVTERYRIPMLWLGGALKSDKLTINKYCSQMDVATTVLGQLGIVNKKYKFGKDILLGDANSFGYYTFHNGFGILTDSTTVVYDLLNTYEVIKEGKNIKENLENGKAYLQLVNKDFTRR